MSLVTAIAADKSRFAVLAGSRICIPRTGAWHADLMVDKPDAFVGAVGLDIGDGVVAMNGTVSVGGAFVDTAQVRIVGGAGGLGKDAKRQHYTDTTARIVLSDLLASVGERLSSTASADVVGRGLEHWTTIAIPVGLVIARLLASVAPDATWRVLPDGSVWVGVEAWPDSGMVDADYELVDMSEEQQLAHLAVDVPRLMPGTTLAGRHVSYVEYQIEEKVRIETWFGEGAGESDRIKAAIAGAVRGAMPDIEYRVWYEATVDAQSDNLVDVSPDPPFGDLVPTMARVPLRYGVPGISSTGATGGKVLIWWVGGDPSKPRAIAWDADSVAGEVTWNAAMLNLGGGGGEAPVLQPYIPALNEILGPVVEGAAAAMDAAAPGSGAAYRAQFNAFKQGSGGYVATKVRAK